MRVGFDVSALDSRHSPGVRRVARSLLAALEARGRLEVVRLAPPSGARLLTWRQLALPRLVEREGLLGIHSFTSALPLLEPGRRVQTVHELPWRHGERENAGPGHRFWARVGSRRADRVVCPTRFVARDLEREGAERVRVVPWGVDEVFLDRAESSDDADRAVLARLLPAWGAEPTHEAWARHPWVLCPGAVRPKKRLDLVLEGVAALDRRSDLRARVIVTGTDGEALDAHRAQARRLGLGARVAWLGSVSDAQLAVLLRNADVVPVLARSEGFGLGVLEAFACGAAVLVPAATAQAEVAGEHGLVLDEPTSTAVAVGIERALARDPVARRARRERAKRHTWDAAARAVEGIWEELA